MISLLRSRRTPSQHVNDHNDVLFHPHDFLAYTPAHHDVVWGVLYIISSAFALSNFLIFHLNSGDSTPETFDGRATSNGTTENSASYSPSSSESSQSPIRISMPQSYLHIFIIVIALCNVFYWIIASFSSIIWAVLLQHSSQFLWLSCLYGVPVTLTLVSINWMNSIRDLSIATALLWTLSDVIAAFLWTYFINRNKLSISKSIAIINYSCSILIQNRPLMFLSCISAACYTACYWLWTWIFIGTFMVRVVEQVPLDDENFTWILKKGSWKLAAFYFLMYLWSSQVISGIQQATISATLSQWSFHREGWKKSRGFGSLLTYSNVAIQSFGSICLSSLCISLSYPIALLTPLSIVSRIRRLSDRSTLSTAIIISTDLFSASAREKGNSNRVTKTIRILSRSRYLITVLAATIAYSYSRLINIFSFHLTVLALFFAWFFSGATLGTLGMIIDALYVCITLDRGQDQSQEAAKLFECIS